MKARRFAQLLVAGLSRRKLRTPTGHLISPTSGTGSELIVPAAATDQTGCERLAAALTGDTGIPHHISPVTPPTGLDRVRAAIRADRGGDAPTIPHGWA